jgi:hypothetical protein
MVACVHSSMWSSSGDILSLTFMLSTRGATTADLWSLVSSRLLSLDANNNNSTTKQLSSSHQGVQDGITTHNNVNTHSNKQLHVKYVPVTWTCCKLNSWVGHSGQTPLPASLLLTPTDIIPPQYFPFVSYFFLFRFIRTHCSLSLTLRQPWNSESPPI